MSDDRFAIASRLTHVGPADTPVLDRLLPSALLAPAADAPYGDRADVVPAWFDTVTEAAIPSPDGTLATAQRTAEALARHAKADNTRRAYRAGVRAWCAWCRAHDLTALPDRPTDRPMSRPFSPRSAMYCRERRKNRLPPTHCGCGSRRSSICTIWPAPPTTTAIVTETLAGLDRLAKRDGQAPKPKLVAKIGILREIVTPIGDDLQGLRDRALLLLLGSAVAFRRAELARIAVGDIEEAEPELPGIAPRRRPRKEQAARKRATEVAAASRSSNSGQNSPGSASFQPAAAANGRHPR